MGKSEDALSVDGIRDISKLGRLGDPFFKTEEEIITELRLKIMEKRYNLKVEDIADRILWYGLHVFRMSNQITKQK